MREVKEQGSKFEEWFQSCGTRINEQAAALSTLQGTVNEQQGELARCRTELQQTMQSSVSSLQAEMSQQLASQLQGQLEQIQALFQGGEKKARNS